jgi:hypothetical protein
MPEDEKRRSTGKGGVATILACGVVIVALLVVVVILLARGKEDVTETKKRNVVVTPDNVEEVIQQLSDDERVTPGSYEVTMNTTWNFKNASSASDNAYVENSTSNTNDVYFDITLADTEEKIYSSPVLPVGSHLENITLDKALDDGTYNCIMTYTLVDDEQNDLSSVRVSMKIVVGS